MKLMFASDIHGSHYFCEKLCRKFDEEKPERLVLLGDLLYHGPRNDLPKGYNPKAVIQLLNGLKDKILCVRGNCEAEVDQMTLDFPIMAEYILMFLDNRTVFATHGHVFNETNPPKLNKGDILLHGHTHIQMIKEAESYVYINPGSVSIPKENNENSYMIYENGKFIIKNLDGKSLLKY